MNIHVHPERESKTAILLLFGAIPNQELIASVRGREASGLFKQAVARILGSLFSFFSSCPFSSSILPPFTMHFLSAVQVPLSATIVRGGTNSVPEMVLSSMHPPASSHKSESPVQAGLRCWWGREEVWNLLTKDGEWSRGLPLPPGGPLQCSARTGLGGRALGGGLLVSVPCAIGKINTVKSACVVSVLFLKSPSIRRQCGFSFPLFKLQLFQSH